MLSILVPLYNEEGAIKKTLSDLTSTGDESRIEYEIIVINDGSRDKSESAVRSFQRVRLLTHRRNQGYGAALKTGLRHAKGEWIAIIDSDGTYRPVDLFRLYRLAEERELDMMVGDRTGYRNSIPWYRRPGKVVIYWLAAFLVWQKVPDINSGLRVFKKSMAEKFMHLYPQGFSFTVTITLAALTSNYLVEWDPIRYDKRIGKSTMNFWRGLFHTFPNFIALVIRIVTYFKPLRFFMIPALLFFLVGVGNLVRTLVYESNISDASLLLLMVATQVGLMGLIADVVVKSRSR
ncbi:MAG: glycosyltransferase family 2 protein [Candidatus Andersenbacteria bacterium]|nr:glycosyltransferase family 2 protein [Candidatus Andersenbacteria bacterium]MBI3250242.1 glycosyltransferase family 2 protein [Candidatus Andersenbacteria bacterium]